MEIDNRWLYAYNAFVFINFLYSSLAAKKTLNYHRLAK